MYVNLSHAWFLNYGLYGNRPYNERLARALSLVEDATPTQSLQQQPQGQNDGVAVSLSQGTDNDELRRRPRQLDHNS